MVRCVDSLPMDRVNPRNISEAMREAVEKTPEFLIKICRREQTLIRNRMNPFLLKYGCGYMTLVLLDGAELPEDLNEVNTIVLRAVVDDIANEQSVEMSETRIERNGVEACDGTRKYGRSTVEKVSTVRRGPLCNLTIFGFATPK